MNSSAAKRAEKLSRRKARKDRLPKSSSSVARKGAPNHGISESTLLEMRMRVEELTRSNNQLVDELDQMKKLDVPNKALEAHYMLRALITILVGKKVFSEPEITDLIQTLQLADSGLGDKQGPLAGEAELGDCLLVRFQIFDAGRVVDEEMTAPIAYDLGSEKLGGCDAGLVGIKPGEARTLTAIFAPGYRVGQIVGREVTVRVECEAIKARKTAAGAPCQAG